MWAEYKTAAREAEASLVAKKSKFLARLKPILSVQEAEEFIEARRKLHWNATHNVPAYIIGPNQEIQKCSDDSEPGGTAGLPILEVLKDFQVVNVVVVVTRHFGGTLLGRGGLIRAYGGVAKKALLKAGIVRMVPAREVAITVNYGHSGRIQNELLNAGIKLTDTEYSDNVIFKAQLFPAEGDKMRQVIQDLTAGEFSWVEGSQVYRVIPLKNDV